MIRRKRATQMDQPRPLTRHGRWRDTSKLKQLPSQHQSWVSQVSPTLSKMSDRLGQSIRFPKYHHLTSSKKRNCKREEWGLQKQGREELRRERDCQQAVFFAHQNNKWSQAFTVAWTPKQLWAHGVFNISGDGQVTPRQCILNAFLNRSDSNPETAGPLPRNVSHCEISLSVLSSRSPWNLPDKEAIYHVAEGCM